MVIRQKVIQEKFYNNSQLEIHDYWSKRPWRLKFLKQKFHKKPQLMSEDFLN